MSPPPGWEARPLGEIAEVRLGRQRSPKHADGPDQRAYVRAANITWSGLDLSDVKTMSFNERERQTYRLQRGDILLAEASGSASEVGKPAVWNNELPECYFQNTLIRVRSPVHDPTFLRYHLLEKALSGEFIGDSKGVGIHHLGSEGLSPQVVSIPPLAEQRRIVNRLDTLVTTLAAGEGELRATQRKLDAYRASVLRAACEGQLIESDAKDVTLGEISEIQGGITLGKKRRDDEKTRSVPYLRVANVQRGYLKLAEVKDIEATEEEIRKLRLQRGDLLLNEGGDRDKLGRGWIWEGQLPECIHQNHVFRARVRADVANAKFVSQYANSVAQKYFWDEGKHTTNIATINRTKLAALPIRLPPLQVQDAIVSEIDRRFSVVDRLEDSIAASLGRSKRLRQAILKHAFEGRLVAQDPRDEPTSVLLARATFHRKQHERQTPRTARNAKAR